MTRAVPAPACARERECACVRACVVVCVGGVRCAHAGLAGLALRGPGPGDCCEAPLRGPGPAERVRVLSQAATASGPASRRRLAIGAGLAGPIAGSYRKRLPQPSQHRPVACPCAASPTLHRRLPHFTPTPPHFTPTPSPLYTDSRRRSGAPRACHVIPLPHRTLSSWKQPSAASIDSAGAPCRK